MTTPSTLPLAWLAVLALITAVGPLSVDMYLPTLPAMAGEFGADASRMQLTLLGFMVGMAVGQLVGPLSDRWGRHRLLIAGTLLSTAAGAACALAPSLEVLVGCRILQGLGGGAGVVLSRAIVADRSEGASAAGAFSLMMIINGGRAHRGAVERRVRRRHHRVARNLLDPGRAECPDGSRSDDRVV